MKAPELKANANIYLLSWPQEQIEIRVDRLSDHNNALSGEILVRSTIPGLAQHLHQARLNLTSTQARHTLAKYLQERMELGPGEWDTAIEQTCVKVLTAYRQGEPVVNLDTWAPEKERLRYRVNPLVFEGQPNLFYGLGGVGKSLFAAYLAVLIQEAYSRPEEENIEVEPGGCLYLDYEASAEVTQERVKAIHAGLGIERGTGLLYRFCHQPLAADIEQVQKVVLENNVQVIVIDSAGPACGAQPESAEATLQFFTALRSLRLTSLILAHAPKNTTHATPFGSVYWTNMARSVFEMKKQQEAGEDMLHFGLFHRKVNTGRLQKPIAFKIKLENDEAERLVRVDVSREKAIKVAEFVKEMPLHERVYELLKSGARTVKEITEEIGEPSEKEHEVRNLLNDHPNKFIRVDKGQKEGTWGLMSSA